MDFNGQLLANMLEFTIVYDIRSQNHKFNNLPKYCAAASVARGAQQSETRDNIYEEWDFLTSQ